METKRLIYSVTVMLALLLSWRLLMNHLLKVHPTWFEQAVSPPATLPVSSDTGAPAPVPSTGPVLTGTTLPTSQAFAAAPPAPVGLRVADAPAAVAATLGADSGYRMTLTVDPTGAGIASVVLVDFNESAYANSSKYTFQQPVQGFESITRPLATRSVSVDGKDLDLSNNIWKQTQASTDSTTYSTVVFDGSSPLLELTKTFKLQPRDAGDGSGYEVVLNQGFRNLSRRAIKVTVTFNGPKPPHADNVRSEDRRYITGYDDGKTVEAGSVSVSDLAKDKPAKDLITSDTRTPLWLGACSSYFESIYQPDNVSGTIKLASAPAIGFDSGGDDEYKRNNPYPTQLTVSTSAFKLLPNATDSLNAHVFLGPKERALLADSYYSMFPRMYDKTLLYISGFCGILTFAWVVNGLYYILWMFHAIFRDWGIAIICLVALVRSGLHPITKRSQIYMVEMSKKGPEMERLKKKFADDKEALVKAQAELMDPKGMLFGCLPMLLQTPIWIALYQALQNTFELRQAGFLRFSHLHLTWIADLSQPDALIRFKEVAIPLIFTTWHVSQVNILPLLLAIVFYTQQALQPAPPNMTPEQLQQRKMMKWMSLLSPVILYSGPSGLNLYILTSQTIGIIESKIIRDHIKQRDEAEKAGRIIVDAAPTRNNRKRRDDDDPGSLSKRGKTSKKPLGGWRGWLADLQAKIEQARREQERRGTK